MKRIAIGLLIAGFTVVFAVRLSQFTNPKEVECQTKSLVVNQNDTYWKLVARAGCVGGFDRQHRIQIIIEYNGDMDLQPGNLVLFP